MSKCATRTAYGKALAELIQENERVVVFDADLAGSTKPLKQRKHVLNAISTWESPRQI